MKKLLYLFSACLLVLTSCSNDDTNSSDSASMILPKSVKYTSPSYPSDNSNATISYDGNKITSIKSEDGRTDYTYDGNEIVKTIDYDDAGIKDSEAIYTYTGGKLASYSHAENFTSKYPTGEYKTRTVYTYNSDGTIKTLYYTTDVTTGVETKTNNERLSTISNGNLVKVVEINSTPGSSVYTTVYEFDTKNSPTKNIAGFNLLVITDEGFGSINNIVKSTSSSVDGSNSSNTNVYKTVYVYDANGYPTKETSYEKDGTTVDGITEYTF
ncbi:hypothetical protein [Flavobacterium laiguense]|uniref:YD repeat-containing protein n=1 Tax=Flavobacterium laiguense TaxID=2169409 RepID=A0A2U1JRE2_9FLAO|nr:hypothetical protein [Flavobacterium laiguense]PWA07767.1 hypothetical protein DB891_13995 [Flavobacterium laiguense]